MRNYEMLAEIFLLRLETMLRESREAQTLAVALADETATVRPGPINKRREAVKPTSMSNLP